MIMLIAGLLVLAVIGYIVIPFVARKTRVPFQLSAEQRNNLETAIELEIQAFRKRAEQTPLQAKE